MTTKYSASGARRSGDYYQDLIAIETILDFLGNADLYNYILIEAQNMVSLDDVVVVRKDGSLELKQVKFSAHPDKLGDQWTWAELIRKDEGKKSLIEKWVSAFQQIGKEHVIYRASVETNRRSDEIQRNLDANNHVMFNHLDAVLKAELIQQIGSEELAEDFFKVFQFNLNRPSLDDFENIQKRRFVLLGLTENNWARFLNKVESWVLKKEKPGPDGRITYEIIQDAVNWYKLNLLDEKFPIPPDFVIPSQSFHHFVSARLKSLTSGCIVITAAPGMGKSTYLSYLYKEFEKMGLPIIRHHYYLSEGDKTTGRCNPEKVAESLMTEILQKYPESLGALKNTSANFSNLSSWLTESGHYFSQKGKALYIIIDGLDHIWHESQPTNELERLFEHIFPLSKGVVVVIGTQPISEDKVPYRLLQAAPRQRWLRLPPLDTQAMQQWIRKHVDRISLPDTDAQCNHILDILAGEFQKKTNGFPLYLRYALKIIEEENKEINYNTIESLPDFADNGIMEYYPLLLQKLPDTEKQILYLLTLCPFSWKENEIIECLDPKITITTITESIRKTKYLLNEDSEGLTLFHNSLRVFLQGQPDYSAYSNVLRPLMSDWLENKAPEYLKEQYFWIIKADMGDVKPLSVEPNREWVLQAIVKLFPRTGISRVLAKSALIALKTHNFSKLIEISYLLDYYNRVFDYQPECIESLLYAQLAVNGNESFNRSIISVISSLTPKQILIFSEYNSDKKDLVRHCFNELNERQRGNRYSPYRQSYEREVSLMTSFFGTAALLDQESFMQFTHRLLNAKGLNVSHALETLCLALRKNRRSTALRELLRLPLADKNMYTVLQHSICLSFEDRFDLRNEVLSNSTHPFAAIYASMHKISDYSIGDIDFPPDVFFNKAKESPYSKEYEVTKVLYDIFFIFLANHLSNNSRKNTQWIKKLPDDWLKQLIVIFNKAAKDLSIPLSEQRRLPFDHLYKMVDTLRRPTWVDDRDFYIFGDYSEKAIHQIAVDLLTITKIYDNSTITKDELVSVLSTKYCDPWNLIDVLILRNRALLSPQAFEWFISKLEARLTSLIKPFYDRAINYGQLANLCALQGAKENSKGFIIQTSKNLLAYGWHKDITLHSTLKTIKQCYENKITESKQMLNRITPAILWVKVFTDGDETRHLISNLGDIISKYEPDLIFDYYNWLIDNNEYDNAHELIYSIINNSDLSIPINISLVCNALDYKGLILLRARAKTDNSAKDILISMGKPLDGISQLSSQGNAQSNSRGLEGRKLPNPADYPPETLKAYLDTLKKDYYFSNGLEQWINYWMNTPQKVSAYSSIKKEIDRGAIFEEFDSVFQLAMAVGGKEEAYQWLVRAQIERHGWNRYYSPDSAFKRWLIIREIYPDRWLQFIDDTLEGMFTNDRWKYVSAFTFYALTEYLLFFGEKKLATICAMRAANNIQELVSPVSLPKPKWITEDKG